MELFAGIMNKENSINNAYDIDDISFLKKDYINLLKANNELKKNNLNALKFKMYYEVLNTFLKIKNKGDSLDRFFKENQIKSIAIYGCGNIADRIAEDINVNIIAYLITDQSFQADAANQKSINVEDFKVLVEYKDLYEVTDAIVITPVFDADKIIQRLKQLGICKRIIGLQEIIDFYVDTSKNTQ